MARLAASKGSTHNAGRVRNVNSFYLYTHGQPQLHFEVYVSTSHAVKNKDLFKGAGSNENQRRSPALAIRLHVDKKYFFIIVIYIEIFVASYLCNGMLTEDCSKASSGGVSMIPSVPPSIPPSMLTTDLGMAPPGSAALMGGKPPADDMPSADDPLLQLIRVLIAFVEKRLAGESPGGGSEGPGGPGGPGGGEEPGGPGGPEETAGPDGAGGPSGEPMPEDAAAPDSLLRLLLTVLQIMERIFSGQGGGQPGQPQGM